jgi:hypothetical protein
MDCCFIACMLPYPRPKAMKLLPIASPQLITTGTFFAVVFMICSDAPSNQIGGAAASSSVSSTEGAKQQSSVLVMMFVEDGVPIRG